MSFVFDHANKAEAKAAQPQKFLYTKISIATFYFCVVSQQSIDWISLS